MRDIAKNIRQARVKNNLTQDELAEKLFVTRQTVSNYETGKSRPDIDMLLRIAEVLGTDVSILLYGKTREQRKDVPRSFWIALAVTLLLGVLMLFYDGALQLMRKDYIAAPALLLKLVVLPLLYIFLGWTAMCGIGQISGVRPMGMPWIKLLRWAVYSLAISYFVIMTPAIIHEFEYIIVRGYVDKLSETIPVLGYSSSYRYWPAWLNMLQGKIWLFSYGKEALFMLFGILLWLFGFPEKREKNYIPLLLGLTLALVICFAGERSFVLEVENPELFQSLPYGIEVIAPSE